MAVVLTTNVIIGTQKTLWSLFSYDGISGQQRGFFNWHLLWVINYVVRGPNHTSPIFFCKAKNNVISIG